MPWLCSLGRRRLPVHGAAVEAAAKEAFAPVVSAAPSFLELLDAGLTEAAGQHAEQCWGWGEKKTETGVWSGEVFAITGLCGKTARRAPCKTFAPFLKRERVQKNWKRGGN